MERKNVRSEKTGKGLGIEGNNEVNWNRMLAWKGKM
jgi:hypothetical protein